MPTGKSVYIRLLPLAVVLVLLSPAPAQAYIGPGAGFAVVGSFLVMFAAIFSAIIALFTWPIRFLIRAIRSRRCLARSSIKRFVILGLDGLDPSLAQQFMAAGKLPNMAKLAQTGCFKPLATTTPSISPVAWSSFQTGVNPGKHNIFDFLTRDKKTYYPKLSSVDIRGCHRSIKLGKYIIPLGKPDIRLMRKGRQFWSVLGDNGIFSNVLRVPITFPPEKFHGVSLSAMCVPDLRGSQGMFTFYTTKPQTDDERTGGVNYHVEQNANIIKARLIGPDNPIQPESGQLKCDFEVVINDKDSDLAILKINKKKYRLSKGIYSDWIKVNFKAGLGISIHGICRFLLINNNPQFELYVTPINIDPEKPAMPISHPMVYSTYLSKLQGPFATLGLAEDSWALNEKILDDKAFVEQSLAIDQERQRMFFDALAKTREGLCVCVFDGTDRLQHSFWRYIDKGHPAAGNGNGLPRQCPDAIEDVYKRMDKLVGETMEKCRDKKTVLMVISDHGFGPFRYGVDLNRWLEENGYLKVNNELRHEKYLKAIDFSQSRAFAVGLSGIYINLKGREACGIVSPGEQANKLRKEIAQKLGDLYDPIRSQSAISKVYIAQEIYTGPYKDEAPDLLVGYQRGYRASWETAVGHVTTEVFHNNVKAWSGDHCIDPALVPGVLFCNRPITTEKPRLMDIGPTVLNMFGVKVPEYMDGKALAVIS